MILEDFEQRALALARYIHVELIGISIDTFMDDKCPCDEYAHKALLAMGFRRIPFA